MDAPCAPMPRERLKLYAAALLELRPHARVRRVALLSMGLCRSASSRNDAAVDELEIGVIEVVGVEVVITHAERASPGKEVHGFFKEERRAVAISD